MHEDPAGELRARASHHRLVGLDASTRADLHRLGRDRA
jgi:hypothetical protein